MSRSRLCFAIVCMSLFMAWPSLAPAQERSPQKLWDDFNHYVLIARPELAQAAGTALINAVDRSELLDIVEASEYSDWLDRTFPRSQGMPSVAATARELAELIQQARIDRARDSDRIAADIERLGQGLQARMNAIERLRAAGQYAAPQLLETLLDPRRASLHPHVLTALVAIGRPVVYPLAEAMPHMEPVVMGQIAQVLAEIGYPLALPYMKLILEDADTDPTARRAVQAAFNQITRMTGRGGDMTAAQLFFTLGMNHYSSGNNYPQIMGYDAAEEKGLLWQYSSMAGLVPIPVPGPIYGDALAMRSARKAMQLQPQMDLALSLWVMGNLRRENRLPEGEQDPSYPAEFQPASFYALLAGPLRLHEVLSRALADRDAALARDAIAALDNTAGTEALLNLQGTIQPLLEALSFPDRRVRYEAAFALTNARPTTTFPGSYQVVPVLAEAVRQTDRLTALIIADNQSALNELQATLRSLEYDTIAVNALAEATDPLRVAAGIDLIVIQSSVNNVINVFNRGASDYKLANAPVLAVASQGDQYQLTAQMPNERRLFFTTVGGDTPTLLAAIESAQAYAADSTISSEEAFHYAVRALQLLREVALVSGEVYVVTDAQPALMLALNDVRDEVTAGAAAVLAMINNAEAQRSLAALSLDTARSVEIRQAALNSLADSATAYGNQLDERTVTRLRELVRTSTGPIAIDAAKAFGALAPATPHAVQLIVQ